MEGYEHLYSSCMSNDKISSYTQSLGDHLDLGLQPTILILRIRTNFLLIKRRLHDDDDDDDDDDDGQNDDDCDEQIMGLGSETLSATVCLPADQRDFSHITYRLNEYLMPADEIQALIQEVFDFAQEITAVDPSIPVVPIVVEVDVCTVQLHGETLDDAIDRSVRPDRLIPLTLVQPEGWKKHDSCRPLLDYLLHGLPRIGVEDEGFGNVMETCSICLCRPTAAAPMSLLPCNHAFHRHCVVKWLLKSWSCPLCRREIGLEILKKSDGRN